ncbi:hypothetical protein [Actinophytocola sp.]|uniref:hypothetical protein n=1 Tax=Actinophytocola sp. TaxID=1872138 RepID=UPI002ED3AC72
MSGKPEKLQGVTEHEFFHRSGTVLLAAGVIASSLLSGTCWTSFSRSTRVIPASPIRR